jgi:hypothetical protein
MRRALAPYSFHDRVIRIRRKSAVAHRACAAANIVAAGICARQGRPITFGTFLRYGLPITLAQLAMSALYLLALTRFLR